MVRSLQTIGLSKDRQQKNALGIVAIATLAFQGVNLFLLFLLTGAYFGVVNKSPQSLVQLEQGRTVAVEPLDSGYRTPAVVQTFVRDTMQLLFSASGSVPGESGMVPDSGVEVATDNGKARISSLAHLALFSLSADFHPSITSILAERTPQEIFTRSGRTQLIMDIRDVSEPIPVPGRENHWEVSVIANKVVLENGAIASLTPFNRTVFVHSIDIPVVKDYSTPAEQQIAEVRKAGLEIYEIKPYVPPVQPQVNQSEGPADAPPDSFITPAN